MNTENILFATSLICELYMYVLIGYFVTNVTFYDAFGFAVLASIIIYASRILVTVGLSFVLNIFRLTPISFKWQLLIFGTPRGPMSLAIAYAAQKGTLPHADQGDGPLSDSVQSVRGWNNVQVSCHAT